MPGLGGRAPAAPNSTPNLPHPHPTPPAVTGAQFDLPDKQTKARIVAETRSTLGELVDRTAPTWHASPPHTPHTHATLALPLPFLQTAS